MGRPVVRQEDLAVVSGGGLFLPPVATEPYQRVFRCSKSWGLRKRARTLPESGRRMLRWLAAVSDEDRSSHHSSYHDADGILRWPVWLGRIEVVSGRYPHGQPWSACDNSRLAWDS